ncbi:MAG: terminase small subunit [Candidatus Thiodiazotropha endolucinida]|uniref:Terminase small subunit n=1 Tax=Candidatus Thiodiazotropha taylori TaxID=2792791 RepID=A0A9E4TTR7_9GAMM|nr:terminase small subunit [Candidatus Thiodiazotropha taylori]MCW4236384.1 terminase small subunit [Candidatus Thiodiazotropha endolucinida]
MSALDELNPRQQIFCREYIIDFNGTRAAIDAGYSEKTASVQASRLLRNVKVQNALLKLIQERNERLRMTSDGVLERLTEESDAKFSDLLDEQGDIKKPKEWPHVWDRMVTSYKITERTDKEGNVTVTREIRKNENPRRLELIGKHIDVQAFRDRLQVVEGNDIVAMKAAQARAIAAQAEEDEDDWGKQDDIEQPEEEVESSTFADDLEAAQAKALASNQYDDEGEY